jgi:hypothetical protein
MPLNGHYSASVRSYLLTLQTGQKPDSRPDVPEYWATPVETIERSYDRSGGNAQVVCATVSTLSRQIPHLRELLETERPAATTPARVDETFGMPPLPEPVRPNEALAAQASPTLDLIIAYIKHWATRSYEGYHEAAALWVLATIAARRIKLPWRDGIWPSLYFLFVSRSGRLAKTEAARYGARIMRECGLEYLLAPNQITPQRFISNLSGTTLPRNYSTMKPEEQEETRLALAFSGQRGWLYDEFGDFLQDIVNGRSQNSLFSQLLRQLYDNELKYRYETNSRGAEVTHLPSLSLVGTSTPSSLMPVSDKSKFWTDGTAARFSFIAPPPDLVLLKSAPKGEAFVPEAIKQRLKAWHKDLGEPHCRIIDVAEQEEYMALAHGEDKKQKKENKDPYIIERGDLPQHIIYWEESGVYEAHEAYHAALVEIGLEHSLDSRLDSSYARLADIALKVAMLLASLENNNQMTLAHWYRGQQFAERCRKSLHCLIFQLDSGAPDHNPGYGTLEDAVQDVLTKKLPKGEKASARQIAQWGNTLLRKAGSPEVRKILDELVDGGDSNVVREGNGRAALYGLKEEA